MAYHALCAVARSRGRTCTSHARRTARVDSDFSTGFSGNDLELSTATIELPIAALSALPLGMPKGWQGTVSGSVRGDSRQRGLARRVARLARPRWARRAAAAQCPGRQLSRRVSASASAGSADHRRRHWTPRRLTAQVIDKDGPFQVDAQLTLGRDRTFLLEGTLAPRGPVPPAMERSLQMLGPADASGRRPFSVGG